MSDRLGYDTASNTFYSPPDVFGVEQLWIDDGDARPAVSPHCAPSDPSRRLKKREILPDCQAERKRLIAKYTEKSRIAVTPPVTPPELFTPFDDLADSSIDNPEAPTSRVSIPSQDALPLVAAVETQDTPAIKVEDKPVSWDSLLERHGSIYNNVKEAIEQYGFPEADVAQASRYTIDEEVPQDTWDECENFWILQASAVAEAEKENTRKQQIIDALIALVNASLLPPGGLGGLYQCAGQDTETPRTPSRSNAATSDTTPPDSQRSRHSGKRKTRSTSPAGDSANGEESGSEENDRTPKTARYTSQGISRLACPYYKRNPQKYMGNRSCVGPGWTTVHRIKEHIRRSHKLPEFQCNRCRQQHSSLSKLKAHQRLEIPCPLKSEEPLEGIDVEQEAKLKSRGKDYRAKPEPEKWRMVYMILFPGDDPNSIPSPFHDYLDLTLAGNCSNRDALARYQAYVQKRLPWDVRQELETRLELELDISQESVKRKAIEILESLQRRTLEEFLRSEGLFGQVCSSPPHPSMPTLIPDPRSSSGSDRDTLQGVGLDAMSQVALAIPLNDTEFNSTRDIFTNEGLNGTKDFLGPSVSTWGEETILSENVRSKVQNSEGPASHKRYPFSFTGLSVAPGTDMVGLLTANEDPMYGFFPDIIFSDNMIEWRTG